MKGDVGACEPPSDGAGTPIRRMTVIVNRRWVTAGTPPPKNNPDSLVVFVVFVNEGDWRFVMRSPGNGTPFLRIVFYLELF